eukprot:717993-Hanusia_phi.AAC.1
MLLGDDCAGLVGGDVRDAGRQREWRHNDALTRWCPLAKGKLKLSWLEDGKKRNGTFAILAQDLIRKDFTRESLTMSGPSNGQLQEPLIEGSKVLAGANLRVLAEDLEQCMEEIESVLAEPKQQGNAVQKASKSIAIAHEILNDLKTQGKQGCRQDRVACDMLIKSYQKKLENLEKNRQAAEAMIGKGTKELSAQERKKAAEAALDRACNIQRDMQESVQRSIGIIQDAQAVMNAFGSFEEENKSFSVRIRGCGCDQRANRAGKPARECRRASHLPWQLKSIYADYTSLEEELSRWRGELSRTKLPWYFSYSSSLPLEGNNIIFHFPPLIAQQGHCREDSCSSS